MPQMVSRKQGILCPQMCIILSMITCLYIFLLATIGSGSCTGNEIQGGPPDYEFGFSCAYMQGEQLDSMTWNTSNHTLSYVSQLYSAHKALWVTTVVLSILRVTSTILTAISSTLETTRAAGRPHARMLVSRWFSGYLDNLVMCELYAILWNVANKCNVS